MELIIDNRERQLADLLTDMVYTKKNLELGDLVWEHEDRSVLVCERKTWADLAASIKDGRFRNQKKRLLETYNPQKLAYIIEGTGDFSDSDVVMINGITKKTLLSCVYNTTLRDNIRVFRTGSLVETVELIRSLHSRLCQDPAKFGVGSVGVGVGAEQIVKVTVRTPQEYFIRALCQIPGVSLKTATAIAAKYSTFADFYKNADEQALKDIFTIDGKGSKRRISTTVVANLIEFLLKN